jgi:hypothetical protein
LNNTHYRLTDYPFSVQGGGIRSFDMTAKVRQTLFSSTLVASHLSETGSLTVVGPLPPPQAAIRISTRAMQASASSRLLIRFRPITTSSSKLLNSRRL